MVGRAIHTMMSSQWLKICIWILSSEIKPFEDKESQRIHDKARYRKGSERKIRIGDCNCAVGSNSSPLLGPHLETP